MPGAAIAELLKPGPDDFFVLKPHLSGFHETPLAMLLHGGGVRTAIIAGFAADACILFTAADAHMIGFAVAVPSDCVQSEKDADRRHVLGQMKKFFDAAVGPSTHLRLRR